MIITLAVMILGLVMMMFVVATEDNNCDYGDGCTSDGKNDVMRCVVWDDAGGVVVVGIDGSGSGDDCSCGGDNGDHGGNDSSGGYYGGSSGSGGYCGGSGGSGGYYGCSGGNGGYYGGSGTGDNGGYYGGSGSGGGGGAEVMIVM